MTPFQLYRAACARQKAWTRHALATQDGAAYRNATICRALAAELRAAHKADMAVRRLLLLKRRAT